MWLVLTFIVHEQDSHVSLREVTLHQQCPVHVSMSPRLRHEQGTEVVQVGLHVATLLQNSGSFNGRVACRKREGGAQ